MVETVGTGRGAGEVAGEAGVRPEISIIIPCFNAAGTLARLLDSIYASDFRGPFEVVLVDDASTDASLEVAGRYPLRVVKQGRNQGVAAARNAGARAATGDLLFFCDSDIRLYPETLRQVVEEFHRASDVEILNCGVTTTPLTPGLVGVYLGYKSGYDYWRLLEQGVTRVEISFIQTLAVAMRARVFEQGQFDVRYQDPGGEEFELGHRLTGRFRLWLYPGIRVDHDTKPWQDRFRVNFRRCARWVPLFLRRGGKFESTAGVATSERGLSTLLSTAVTLGIPAGVIHPGFALLGLGALAVKVPLSWDFFRLLAREQGLGAAAFGFPFELVYETCFGLGFAWGLGQVAGEKLGQVARAPRRLWEDVAFLFQEEAGHLVWFCTAVCNQRCGHCFYHSRLNQGAQELSLEEIRRISAGMGRLHYLTLTGGEPSTRGDLVDCVAVFYAQNGLKQVGYHTNGFQPKRIFEQVQGLIQRCPGLTIICSVSIDHLEEGHDRLRGVKGAYARAVETLELLKPLRRYRQFDLVVNTTYCAENASQIMEIHQHVVEDLGVNHAVGLVRGAPKEPGQGRVSLEGYKAVKAALAARPGLERYSWAFARRLLDEATHALVLAAAEDGRFSLPCTAGKRTLVLSETGELRACELLEGEAGELGRLREADYAVGAVLAGEKAGAVREEISRGQCFCTWECVQPNNLLFHPAGRRFLARLAWSKVVGGGRPGVP